MKVRTEDAIALFGVLLCILFGAAGMGDWIWASVAGASSVFMRRRFTVFAVLTAIVPFAYTTVYGSFTLIGQLMAVVSAFLCGASRAKHCRLVGLASCLLPVVAFGLHLAIIRSTDWTMPVAGLFAGSLMLAAWQAGRLNRVKDMRLEAEEERRIMAERDSDMRARLAVLEERMRINHEMHDILAHTLTGITVQAESGRTTTADSTARTVFADISQASREAVADLRALLSDNTKEDRLPEPTLNQFDDLIAGYRKQGLVIDLHQEYTQSPYLPTGLSHAVYRVAEECLTNALRYAQPRCVDLSLTITGDDIRLHCENPYTSLTHTDVTERQRHGHGLDGIRWRCEQYDGRASVSMTDGLYSIDAVWPLHHQREPLAAAFGETADGHRQGERQQ
ncbi:sensor histidine kinase [Bifidobacterium callimiconis]|uniref:histidine kinase n=1 Tax=Bifidobacterium callimiconis TaxID=2306973 RepID=A0A430FHN1_9BIFI|nr:histidine kinase [Bifidobacterium callimiconis]RSX52393.1 Two component system sensor histidine kinase [Bifidobacterium callimiconis]